LIDDETPSARRNSRHTEQEPTPSQVLICGAHRGVPGWKDLGGKRRCLPFSAAVRKAIGDFKRPRGAPRAAALAIPSNLIQI
jgi:hypothetical protein